MLVFREVFTIIEAMKNIAAIKSRKGGCLFSIFKLFLLLVVIAIVAVYFFLTPIVNMALVAFLGDSGVKDHVGALKFNIASQEVDVRDFYITNPPNYSDTNAMSFSQAYVKTDLNPIHIFTKKLVTVDEIKIVGLNATVELSTGKGLAALFTTPKSNLTELAAAITPKSDGDDKAAEPQPAAAQSEPSEGQDIKVIIKKIVFEDGKTTCGINKDSFTMSLPSFTIENLGVKEGGLTPSELAAQVMGKLASKITVDVAQELVKRGIKIGEGAGNEASEAADGAANKVESGLKNVSNALKSLF